MGFRHGLLGSVSHRFLGDIETIVAKALDKEKARRYESAAELAAEIPDCVSPYKKEPGTSDSTGEDADDDRGNWWMDQFDDAELARRVRRSAVSRALLPSLTQRRAMVWLHGNHVFVELQILGAQGSCLHRRSR